MTPLRHTRRVFSLRLTVWSLVSIGIGVPAWLLLIDRPFWGPFFAHCWIWGAIDLVFALMGLRQSQVAARTPLTPAVARLEHADGRKLLATLQFSHKLNWVWLATAGGLYLWAVLVTSPVLAGHGTGVLVQGGFLFLFDRRFDAELRRTLAEAPDGPTG